MIGLQATEVSEGDLIKSKGGGIWRVIGVTPDYQVYLERADGRHGEWKYSKREFNRQDFRRGPK